jgi:hypothetical protein
MRTLGGLILAALAAVLLLVEAIALIDPAGTKLADDADPFGSPAPWYVHVLWFAVIALFAALSARLLRSRVSRGARERPTADP